MRHPLFLIFCESRLFKGVRQSINKNVKIVQKNNRNFGIIILRLLFTKSENNVIIALVSNQDELW